jgi:hypothetical protein
VTSVSVFGGAIDMPYAPATEPLESFCVLEGKRCTVAEMNKKKAVLERQDERLRKKGLKYDAVAVKAKALRETGMQYKDISVEMGMTEDAVYRLMKRKS